MDTIQTDTGLLGLVALVATIIGAIAAVMQLLQGRSRRHGEQSASPQGEASDAASGVPDDAFPAAAGFWCAFVHALAWMFVVIAGIRSATWPAYIILGLVTVVTVWAMVLLTIDAADEGSLKRGDSLRIALAWLMVVAAVAFSVRTAVG
ncbi:hypothetical protein HTZ77_07485 [Nonomuraea sp. SMC257]|uniref:Uncharacterized protein n=1 Tax=Nonomuraea montanisoli TaxID=2741721 RepID=A0A7Y6M156_9ACTN|nr:hypothetical protein [Nonomuraea montanisoli]NUW31263.1 hypothetical protein [Nonomuraea montanisoli]